MKTEEQCWNEKSGGDEPIGREIGQSVFYTHGLIKEQVKHLGKPLTV